MFQKLRKVIQNEELFSKKDLLLVGVSGGMDSMMLCQFLLEEAYSFIIVHCNYHLRGMDSDLDEQFIKNWADEHRISFYAKSCYLLEHTNIQEEARKIRYDFFKEIKSREKCNYILTAHHSNDQVETFFINLARGSGINGLKGMLPKSNDLVRPLLYFSKTEINEYVIKHGIPFREDQSNQTTFYLRNFLRLQIIPAIRERIPSFNEMAIRSMNHLSEASLILNKLCDEWSLNHVIADSKGIKIKKPDIEYFYFISNLLADLGFHPETIHQIKIHYGDVGKQFTDKNEHQLLVDRDFIFIRKVISKDKMNTYTLNKEYGELQLEHGMFSWNMITNPNGLNALPKSNHEVVLDINQLQFPLKLRKWIPGDTIKPIGMNGKTKKIQDVLSNHKINLFEKEKILVLISGKDILWIPSIMRSELAKIDNNTSEYFQISWKQLD